jgi:hypothetical protein
MLHEALFRSLGSKPHVPSTLPRYHHIYGQTAPGVDDESDLMARVQQQLLFTTLPQYELGVFSFVGYRIASGHSQPKTVL